MIPLICAPGGHFPRSEETDETMPAKSAHRSGNKRVSMVTLLKGPGALTRLFLLADL